PSLPVPSRTIPPFPKPVIPHILTPHAPPCSHLIPPTLTPFSPAPTPHFPAANPSTRLPWHVRS
ncbi:unnamed protein product, partial [Closterium sp. NIES-65]